MLFLAVSCLMAGLVAASPAGAATAGTSDAAAARPKPTVTWPQFMFDAGRTGFNDKETAINRQTVNNLDLDYIAAGPADFERGRFAGSSPAVVDGVAYIGDALGNLLALPATGCRQAVCQPLWSATLSNGIHSTPAVDGGRVFVATSGNVDNGLGQLYAFSTKGCRPAKCKPLWVAQVPNSASSPAVAGGVVYIASADGLLRAYAEAGCGKPTCGPLWTGAIGTSAEGAPAVAGGVVYVTSQDTLFAFRASGCGAAVPTCPPLWQSTPADGFVQNSGPTVSGATVYYASDDFSGITPGSIYAFDAAGCGAAVCDPKWVAHPNPGDNVVGTMAVANGVLYASTTEFLYAFDANGCGASVCGFLWIGELDAPVAGTSASPVVAGGLVFYGTDSGFIGAFDAGGCGDIVCPQVWLTLTNQFDTTMSTPVVVNGRLYVAGARLNDQSAMYVYHLP
jgi:hypothetical protein